MKYNQYDVHAPEKLYKNRFRYTIDKRNACLLDNRAICYRTAYINYIPLHHRESVPAKTVHSTP